MLFDKLAGYVERHDSSLISKVQDTALFEFPYRAHEAIHPGMFLQEDLELFFLPFPEVAIEDKATCTFLFDTVPRQMGLREEPREFIDVLPLATKDPEAFRERTAGMEDLQSLARQEGLHQITFGRLFSMHLPTGGSASSYRVEGQVDRLILMDGRGRILTDMTSSEMQGLPETDETFRGVIGNVITAIEEMMLVNRDPRLFVFERAPVKARPPKKGRILRSHDRPCYVPLKADEIRKIMGVKEPSEGASGGCRPHERRRHWRTLKSEMFTHKRGQRILVEAHWVGPSEAVAGKTRYRVRLDI